MPHATTQAHWTDGRAQQGPDSQGALGRRVRSRTPTPTGTLEAGRPVGSVAPGISGLTQARSSSAPPVRPSSAPAATLVQPRRVSSGKLPLAAQPSRPAAAGAPIRAQGCDLPQGLRHAAAPQQSALLLSQQACVQAPVCGRLSDSGLLTSADLRAGTAAGLPKTLPVPLAGRVAERAARHPEIVPLGDPQGVGAQSRGSDTIDGALKDSFSGLPGRTGRSHALELPLGVADC